MFKPRKTVKKESLETTHTLHLLARTSSLATKNWMEMGNSNHFAMAKILNHSIETTKIVDK